MYFVALLGYEEDWSVFYPEDDTNNDPKSRIISNNTLLLSHYIYTHIDTCMCDTWKSPTQKKNKKQRCGSDERSKANEETVDH